MIVIYSLIETFSCVTWIEMPCFTHNEKVIDSIEANKIEYATNRRKYTVDSVLPLLVYSLILHESDTHAIFLITPKHNPKQNSKQTTSTAEDILTNEFIWPTIASSRLGWYIQADRWTRQTTIFMTHFSSVLFALGTKRLWLYSKFSSNFDYCYRIPLRIHVVIDVL